MSAGVSGNIIRNIAAALLMVIEVQQTDLAALRAVIRFRTGRDRPRETLADKVAILEANAGALVIAAALAIEVAPVIAAALEIEVASVTAVAWAIAATSVIGAVPVIAATLVIEAVPATLVIEAAPAIAVVQA